MHDHHAHTHVAESFRPRRRGSPRRLDRSSSSSPTGTRSSSRSRRSRSRSATRRCGCSPTTARSPARRCRCPRARTSPSTSRTAATSRRPCTGTGCGSRTASTGRTTRRRRSRSARRFTYRVHVPDPGAYWYHPHIREDYGQEMGLYGNIIVVPADPDYWPPAQPRAAAHPRRHPDRGREDRAVQPRPRPRYVAMGRFGNVMLVGGRAGPRADGERGEVVRLYLTNTANTRVFNVALRRRAHEAGRRRQRATRARGARRRGAARALRARRRRRRSSTSPAS